MRPSSAVVCCSSTIITSSSSRSSELAEAAAVSCATTGVACTSLDSSIFVFDPPSTAFVSCSPTSLLAAFVSSVLFTSCLERFGLLIGWKKVSSEMRRARFGATEEAAGLPLFVKSTMSFFSSSAFFVGEMGGEVHLEDILKSF